MLLAVRISSYGCTWEVWRALKKLELLSATPRATLTLLSCSPNFPTRYTHAKHEPIHKCRMQQAQKPEFLHINYLKLLRDVSMLLVMKHQNIASYNQLK